MDSSPVGSNVFLTQHLPHLSPAAGITHHRGPPANDGNRPMPGPLQMHHRHDWDETAGMKRSRRAIIANVIGDWIAT